MPLGKPFFESVRKNVTGGRLTAGQVDGLNRIMAEWERRGLTDVRWLANILAQSFWESARSWQPILEGGSKAYLRSKPYWPYIGAGLIHDLLGYLLCSTSLIETVRLCLMPLYT